MLNQRAKTSKSTQGHEPKKLTQKLPLHICKLPLNHCMQEGHLEMHDKEQTKLTLHRAVKPPAQAG
jgi:hypothetical protein